ncbi:hypothetical protein [Isoalcanivorax indicus]|uniref:hypothetical protein n=1 Tax=Isoalcanivorax indicus TaxID=2202653 RepID=UPI000DB97B57|nr:hypothetical protein [Isoalcanivorax indicus]
MKRIAFLSIMAAAGALVACGGGGSGDGSGGPSGGGGQGGDTLPVLSGLAGDADNQDYLYYTVAIEGSEGLYAVDPQNPASPLLVDAGLAEGLTGPNFDYERLVFPIHEATITVDGGIADFRVVQVFYGDGMNHFPPLSESLGYQRVSTDTGVPMPSPVSVSSAPGGIPFQQGAFFQFDLNDALGTLILYRRLDDWLQISVGDGGQVAPLEMDADHEPVATVLDAGAAAGGGYLVVDTGNNNRLLRLDVALDVVGAVNAGGAVLEEVTSVQPLGSPLADGSQYLVIGIDEEQATLWRYQPGGAGAGTVEPVLSASGEPYGFPVAVFGQIDPVRGSAALPPAEHIATHDGVLFFKLGEFLLFNETFDLVRVEGTSWSLVEEVNDTQGPFLVATENGIALATPTEIIAWNIDGSGRRVLDADDRSIFGQEIENDFFAIGGGWLFYNRSQGFPEIRVAAAVRLDGSESLNLHDARWVGASTDGTAAAVDQLSLLSASEVFLLRDNGELAALSSADPRAGAVTLGNLPEGSVGARLFGLAPGPYRLVQSRRDGGSDPDEFDVLYVDTRTAGSLVRLTPTSSPLTPQRPVSGF